MGGEQEARHRTPNWRTSRLSEEGKLHFEPTPRHYRIYLGEDRTGPPFMQSKSAYLVWESSATSPKLAFPLSDIQWAHISSEKAAAGLVKSRRDQEQGMSKLANEHYDLLKPDGIRIKHVAYSYSESTKANDEIAAPLTSLIVLQTSRFPSAWEEDARILDHVKNPYHRVDAVPSSRHIQVHAIAKSGKEVLLVNTALSGGGTVAVFETGLPTRWYLPADAFQVNGLDQATLSPPPGCAVAQYPSDGLRTTCPYKGVAQYHSIQLPGTEEVMKNVAWSYPEHIPELDLRGLTCLWTPGNVSLKLLVDGERVKG